MPTSDHQRVLREFGVDVASAAVTSLAAAGGFSGARFWRVSTDGGDFCLRRWPAEHPSAERLRWIHAVLNHCVDRGLTYVPQPLGTARGETFVSQAGRLWELTPWMPGVADFHARPSPAKRNAAMHALASFHRVAAIFPSKKLSNCSSPGMQWRRDRYVEIIGSTADRLSDALMTSDWPELVERGNLILRRFRALAPSLQPVIHAAVDLRVPLQPCIRDVWHDHVLFIGDGVTGLVDFGAMNVETVAGDVARLLGSLVRSDLSGWNDGLAAYESVRPLNEEERALVFAFDRANVLLSGIQWIDWICLEGRHFADSGRVIQRLDEALNRMSQPVQPWNVL